MKSTIFESNDQVAHTISDYLAPQKFSLRPYNRFLPEFTEWWLYTPRLKESWPAYRYSKLFFHKHLFFEQSPSESLYTGFYVEKGFDETLSSLPGVKQNHIMQPDWDWYKFLLSAKSGDVGIPIREVLSRTQCTVLISVDAQEFNKPPEPDTERPPTFDLVEFEIHSQDLKFASKQESEKSLANLNSCRDMQELGLRLSSMENLRFFWVNVLIGIQLEYGGTETGSWGAHEIWSNALEPWSDWV
jgi:hypothetical protein